MNEREILKRLVEAWDRLPSVDKLRQCFADAKTVLAQNTDPEPEHPAVKAYRKWRDSLSGFNHGMADAFLAGWKQALLHIAGTFDGQCEKHLVAASDATPTQLPSA